MKLYCCDTGKEITEPCIPHDHCTGAKPNPSVIPEGLYCYKALGFSNDLLMIEPCPYYKHTNHGTVRCLYSGEESVDPTAAGAIDFEIAVEHFGGIEKMYNKIDCLSLLWDGVKECGINEGVNDEE